MIPTAMSSRCIRRPRGRRNDGNLCRRARRLVGSFTHGHAAPAAVKQAGYDVVAAVFTGQYDSAQAVKELVKAVAAAKE